MNGKRRTTDHSRDSAVAQRHARSDERGIVLVLSLLLLSVVTAVGIGVSLLVVNEIQGSIQVDEGIVATYAAEAKVEQALEIIRERRLEPGFALNTVICDISGVNPFNGDICPGLSGTVSIGGVSADVDTSGTNAGQSFLLTALAKDQSVQFDVQTDDCFLDDNDPSCVKSITFSGQKFDPAGSPPWVELTTVAYSGAPFATGASNVQKRLIPESDFDPGPKQYNFLGSPPDTISTDVQTVRLTALDNGVKNLEIRAFTKTQPLFNCSSTPCSSDILGHININAIGAYGRALIGVSATVPWRLPSSGIFDYAIFSQETVKQE